MPTLVAAISILGTLAVVSAAIPSVHAPAASPVAGGSHFVPETSWTSYYAAWHTYNDVNESGTGCTVGTGSFDHEPHMTSDSSGVVSADVLVNPVPSSPCTLGWMSASGTAGEHACIGAGCPSYSNYYDPTTTGFYTFTATWELSMSMYVFVTCPAGGDSGNSLSNYAYINVTPLFAIYNQSMPDGWTVPNTFQPVFHLDSRDAVCVTNIQGIHYIDLTRTLTQTVTSTTLCYLTAGDYYEPRAALNMQAFVVSGDTYTASAEYQTSAGTGSTIATLTSIALV